MSNWRREFRVIVAAIVGAAVGHWSATNIPPWALYEHPELLSDEPVAIGVTIAGALLAGWIVNRWIQHAPRADDEDLGPGGGGWGE
jgi:hypothetical protein